MDIEFEGSRNYCEENVSDFIWFSDPGTKIEIEILLENKVKVKKYGK